MTYINSQFASNKSHNLYGNDKLSTKQTKYVWKKKRDLDHKINITNMSYHRENPSLKRLKGRSSQYPESKIPSKIHKWVWKRVERNLSESKKEILSVSNEVKIGEAIEKPMPIPGLRLIENFISKEMHDAFMEEMRQASGKKEGGVTQNYTFKNFDNFNRVFSRLIEKIFKKLKEFNFSFSDRSDVEIVCSLIGYEKDGYISKHIDSNKLSGGPVVIVSFGSPVVVNFYPEKVSGVSHKIFVPPMSMYSTSNEARDSWSHAILSGEDTYKDQKFTRDIRYALIMTPPGSETKSNINLKY